MPGTSDLRRMVRHTLLVILAVAALSQGVPVMAHPMPNSEVTVARGAQTVNLVIRVPLPELMLALPLQSPRDAKSLLSDDQRALQSYFAAHTRLLTMRGAAIPVTIGSIRLHQERNPDVGNYAELEVAASARIGGSARLSLAYDGVVHRIANHRVMVRDLAGRPLGTVRYNLSTKASSYVILPGT